MNLLLIDNLLFEGGLADPRFDLQPHLGLMSLVAVARDAGHRATILDPRQLLVSGVLHLNASLYPALAQIIADQKADAIGFTALGCNMHCVVQTAQCFRRIAPGRPILLGGPHATILHRELLETFACFDIIARHEAEHSLPQVLDALDKGTSLFGIPGITYRSIDGHIFENAPAPVIDDLDALPVPDYGAYPLEILRLDEIRVEAGRGCPFSCSFCSTATFFGRRYRLKSAARLVSEMDMLAERYGYTRFKLNHDLFTVNRKKILEFCTAVADRGFEWSCSARMDCVDAELLVAMTGAGCRNIYFGVETGSARMQDISRKRLDIGLIGPTLEEVQRLSIRSTTSFIAGYPEETLPDLDATLDAVGEAHLFQPGLNDAQLHLLTPEPGTELMAMHCNSLRLDAHVSEFNFPRLSPDDDGLLLQHPDLFPNHHHFPTVIGRDRLVFVTSLWPVLYELNRPILACLLAAHDNRLSRLADLFFSWASRHPPERAKPSLGNLTAYLSETFGVYAPVTSIIRFVEARARILRAGPSDQTAPVDLPSEGLCLSCAAALLPACHDIPALLSDIERTGHAAMFGAQRLSDWLLLHKNGEIRLYALNADTICLLGMFATPVRLEDVVQKCLASPGAAVPAPEDITDLIEIGVLERVPAPARHAA